MKKTAHGEARAISARCIAQLATFPIKGSGQAGADFRWAIGRHMANFSDYLEAHIIGSSLWHCFETAFLAGATLDSMDNVRVSMFKETPRYLLGLSIINEAIMLSYVEQSKIIAAMEFKSQSEVDAMIDRMSLVIEDIKLNKADSFVAGDYQNFIGLSALLIQHLAATRRVLPRIVHYRWQVHYPSLALSNRIYGNGTRSEELIAENHTVHPAFMQRHVIALSV